MSPWTNMYEEGGIDTSHAMIAWDEGTPHNNDLIPMMNPIIGCNNMIESQPFDLSKIYDATTSSIDQSLECLLSGTNSNTETTSDEDDGISMLFSTKNICPQNYWNFSSNKTVTEPVHRTSIPTSNNNNPNPRKRSQTSQENQQKHMKKQRSNNTPPKNISFQIQSKESAMEDEQDEETIQEMKEMIYRAAALRPVSFGDDPVERPKRKNVRISNDPQTAAARQRRERISERLRLLQKLVPGGTKLDTASMLDEAASYLKFLRNQVHDLETFAPSNHLLPSSNNPFFTTPPNLLFSPCMLFPMQGNAATSTSTTTSLPLFLPPNPNFTHVPHI